MSNIIKRVLSALLIALSMVFMSAFVGDNVYATNELGYNNPIKILCAPIGCPGHFLGEPYCVPAVPKILYFNSYKGDIDTTKDIENISSYFEAKHYSVENMTNVDFSEMKRVEDDYNLMNRKYYFISSHGSESGRVYFDGNSYSLAKDFPNMSNVEEHCSQFVMEERWVMLQKKL